MYKSLVPDDIRMPTREPCPTLCPSSRAVSVSTRARRSRYESTSTPSSSAGSSGQRCAVAGEHVDQRPLRRGQMGAAKRIDQHVGYSADTRAGPPTGGAAAPVVPIDPAEHGLSVSVHTAVEPISARAGCSVEAQFPKRLRLLPPVGSESSSVVLRQLAKLTREDGRIGTQPARLGTQVFEFDDGVVEFAEVVLKLAQRAGEALRPCGLLRDSSAPRIVLL